MKHILIRCDASLLIGSGHVMRCRTLARHLRTIGSEIIFICRRQAGDLISLLQDEFTVLSLPQHQLQDSTGLSGRYLYKAWLGCSQQEDAHECLLALKEEGVFSPTWIIVDHYGLDFEWQNKMLENFSDSTKLFVIDDLADRPHSATLLLDQNLFSKSINQRYSELLPSECIQLLGPDYALLGPEYDILNPLVPVRKSVARVLIYFGGVDENNLTGAALKVLMEPCFSHLQVDVVLGLQSFNHTYVSELVSRRSHTFLYNSLPSLAGLMARADISIGASGSTSWERCCLKLPSLIAVCGFNQADICRSICDLGAAVPIAESSFANDIYSSLESLCYDKSKLEKTSSNAGKLCDGKGVSRVCEYIMK